MSYYELRTPAHAGTFYAGTSDALKGQIESCFLHKFGPQKIPKAAKGPLKGIVALISPHAGYVYSGPVAAHGFYRLAMDGTPDVVVALGPNHTFLGSDIAIVIEGTWKTPLGNVEIDKDTALKILRSTSIIDVDSSAHRLEHSLEVQLPFLQYLYGEAFRFIPISLRIQDLTSIREIGEAIARGLSGMNGLIVATTDLTHYASQILAKENDRRFIDAALKLDESELLSVVGKFRISACGPGPVAAAIVAAKKLGASTAELLSYRTSGDITGDYSAVVGYSSIEMCR